MGDTALSFEGERSHQYRILRATKNRFGGTDEIGVFAMEEEGLSEVANPSALFLTHRGEGVSGATVFPALEGTRPVLVEIQALVVRLASGATPRRAVVGRSEEHTSELQSLMRISYAVFCLKKKKKKL